MKRVVCLALALCLLCCGCQKGADEPIPTEAVGGDIVGVYEQKLDMAVWLIENYPDEQVMYYFPETPEPRYFYLTVTFGEDGTYQSVLNTGKTADSVKAFVGDWIAATRKYYEDLIEYNEMNVTVDEMFADYAEYKGETMEETFRGQLDMAKMADVLSTKGTYRVEGEKLYRGTSDDVYETYTATEDALYVLSSNDDRMTAADKAGYPYTFEKIK